MCGIVGYLGSSEAAPIIIDGLRRLEYRGYDSAGIAIGLNGGPITVRRAAGKLNVLESAIQLRPIQGNYGIGHTRWATHGPPTEQNAHPHCDQSGDIAVVHNGIIENEFDLRNQLRSEGFLFATDTDTEIVAHLLDKHSRTPGTALEDALRQVIGEIRGVFALAVISRRDPDKLVVARSGPPVAIGLAGASYFVASDISAILPHARDVLYLRDGDVAVLTPKGMRVIDFQGQPVRWPLEHIQCDWAASDKGEYEHFMLKEIFEQPSAVRRTIHGRVNAETGSVSLDELGLTRERVSRIRQIRIIACGTSWHAALAGKFMIEKLARMPVEVDYSSEFRYRDPILDGEVLTVSITQSGETADTLAAQREAVRKGSPTIAICNVTGSSITREAGSSLITRAGPEIGVASTKAFTSQLAALFLLALHMAQLRDCVGPAESRQLARQLVLIPNQIENVLRCRELGKVLARKYSKARDALFLGRGVHYPIAMEGALKLKEISYIHAEGCPAGEMKHGQNALIDDNLLVVMLAAHDPSVEASRILREKTISSLKEVQARGGKVIAVINHGDQRLKEMTEDCIEIPAASELLLPILEVVPLQLFAYQMAVLRGCDVDQPRNLAKSVTVE
jgi:glucosamine--fructose-6-phosphate aminotransferase (isomerizing)